MATHQDFICIPRIPCQSFVLAKSSFSTLIDSLFASFLFLLAAKKQRNNAYS